VYDGYQLLMEKDPDRIKGIDADQSIEEVYEETLHQIKTNIDKKP
jgi:dTMP kinase